MRAAVWPRAEPAGNRLLLVDPASGGLADRQVRDLPDILAAGDLLVVNDAATLPASLHGTSPSGRVELRLAGQGPASDQWQAVVFGDGSWRTRTEDRRAPPALRAGDVVEFEADLRARVRGVSPLSPRLVDIEFDRADDALWSALYRAGRPVQYSHVCGPLKLWHVQTAYAARPWAVEMPSAGHALTPALLRRLRRQGIAIATITHAAGLSSTGVAELDARLPLPERYDVPPATVDAVERTRMQGGRVVAAGTTVVRALEGCAHAHDGLRAATGITDVRISAALERRVVDGILTGIHLPGTSHFELLQAFAPATVLEAATRHAAASGYLAHEFGDVALILPTARPTVSSPPESSRPAYR